MLNHLLTKIFDQEIIFQPSPFTALLLIDEPHHHNQNPLGANGHSPLRLLTPDSDRDTITNYSGFYIITDN
ncbi:MAG: hypothetical protein F6K22_07035 [Okeania sp. SIO2F4]|nr:hypothetical protein [Okeania sp. SIO2F4]